MFLWTTTSTSVAHALIRRRRELSCPDVQHDPSRIQHFLESILHLVMSLRTPDQAHPGETALRGPSPSFFAQMSHCPPVAISPKQASVVDRATFHLLTRAKHDVLALGTATMPRKANSTNPMDTLCEGMSARSQSSDCVAVTPLVTEGPLCGSPRSSLESRRPLDAMSVCSRLGQHRG